MIYLTAAAAKQIKASAKASNLQGLPLRIAVTQKEGEMHYGMGFDDAKENDKSFTSEGVEIIVSEVSLPLAHGMTLDFVSLEEGGEPQFIFMNPNDPNYVPPKK